MDVPGRSDTELAVPVTGLVVAAASVVCLHPGGTMAGPSVGTAPTLK